MGGCFWVGCLVSWLVGRLVIWLAVGGAVSKAQVTPCGVRRMSATLRALLDRLLAWRVGGCFLVGLLAWLVGWLLGW